MHDKEQEVISMTYDPSTPVDTVFSVVEKFRGLCILTEQPKTDAQLTNVAYIIFNKPWFFMDSLKNWNKKTTNKTYADFKIHMRREYNELRQVGALSISDSKLQAQLNHTQNSQDFSSQISATVSNNLRSTIMDTIMALNNNQDIPSASSTEAQVNAVNANPNDVTQLCTLIDELRQEVNYLKSNNYKPLNTVDCNPKTSKPWRRYCHTHGCCNHWGCNCKDKAPGHKDDATFRNRMGGSNLNCLPIQN